MDILRFKNNEIRKIVYNLLDKTDDEPISIEELNQIEILNINPRIFKNPTLEVDLADLSLFKNLKVLYLRDMFITNYHIECLNQVQSLNYLQMNKCKMKKINISLYLENLERMALVATYGIDMRILKDLPNIKVLKIISSSIIKYKGIENLKSLEELYLQDIDRVRLTQILKMNNLSLINLDGSSVKKERHENILKNRISVEHQLNYMIA